MQFEKEFLKFKNIQSITTQIYDIINKEFHQDELLLFNKKAIYMVIYKYEKHKNNEVVSVDIPENYIYTIQNAKFLLHDSGKSGIDRFIIFDTIKNCISFKNSSTIHADGIFKIAHSQFYQVYILYCGIHDTVFPCLYCYLSNKTESTYIRLFKTINQLARCVKAKNAIFDIEIAAINAFTKVFMNVNIHICIFHLGQAWWRKIQNLGLSSDYKNVRGKRNIIRQISALCFVPIENIESSFNLLFDEVLKFNDNRLIEFSKYFFVNYIDDNTSLLK
ncbi:hypothetical protein DMUE_5256 [Dictyocoela muelleri]|nr:hypothetical protein DMUE_5256 [Dictyocoela muelleri]